MSSVLAGRQILVTGAGGFIGSHLVERLVAEGAGVRALVRYNSRNEWGALDWVDPSVTTEVEVMLGDLRDVEAVDAAVAKTDVVFHLAAQIAIPYSYVNPRGFFETNLTGSLNVAQAARRHDVALIVHASTSEVYGSAQTIPITESHPLHPQSPYAASKVGADMLMDAFHASFGLPVTILRPFNTFGPRQSARAIIPTIITQALDCDQLRLGSLDPRRDLTFVDDTVAGFIAAATSPAAVGRTVQLGTGSDVAIGDIVTLIGQLLDRELEVIHDPGRVRPANSEVTRLISDPRLADELLGWTPTVALSEGVKRTIAYIERHRARYRSQENVI